MGFVLPIVHVILKITVVDKWSLNSIDKVSYNFTLRNFYFGLPNIIKIYGNLIHLYRKKDRIPIRKCIIINLGLRTCRSLRVF